MKLAVVSIVLAAVALAAGVAEAYPQFQLARDQTCTGCHISPAGGSMLNENGFGVAEAISQFGTKPEFFYGDRFNSGTLQLGGDVRGAGGFLKYGGSEDSAVYAFPMQIELQARLKFGAFSVFLNGGFRPPQDGHRVDADTELEVRASTYVWSREHYLMWQQKPDENYGLYVRAGRFMPVFGLRFAEHPMYTKRFGGTQLFSETYGLAVEYIDPKYEFHVTGFMNDPLIDPVEHATGAAFYGELRASETLAFGAELMFKNFTNGEPLFSSDSDSEMKEIRAGITNKLYLSGPEVLISTEIQFVNQLVDKVSRSVDSAVGGAPKGLVGNITVSRMFADFLLLDVGIGHFDSNFRVPNIDRDCIDVNFHWFTTSHLELMLNARYETIGFNKGADPGAYALIQAHYRL
ncbi:MAG: hypothetical protein ABI867_33945 [Kofleriaceae bacterium]